MEKVCVYVCICGSVCLVCGVVGGEGMCVCVYMWECMSCVWGAYYFLLSLDVLR